MRIRIALLSLLFSLLSAGFLVSNTQIASAGCGDYPESTTPATLMFIFHAHLGM